MQKSDTGQQAARDHGEIRCADPNYVPETNENFHL
jgi:hypothetical protein